MKPTEIKTLHGYKGTMTSILYDREEYRWVGKCVLVGCTYNSIHTHDMIPLSDITPITIK